MRLRDLTLTEIANEIKCPCCEVVFSYNEKLARVIIAMHCEACLFDLSYLKQIKECFKILNKMRSYQTQEEKYAHQKQFIQRCAKQYQISKETCEDYAIMT